MKNKKINKRNIIQEKIILKEISDTYVQRNIKLRSKRRKTRKNKIET